MMRRRKVSGMDNVKQVSLSVLGRTDSSDRLTHELILSTPTSTRVLPTSLDNFVLDTDIDKHHAGGIDNSTLLHTNKTILEKNSTFYFLS